MSVSVEYPFLTSYLAKEMERYLREVAIAETQCCCHCPKCGRRYSDQDNGDEDDEEDDEQGTTTLKPGWVQRIAAVLRSGLDRLTAWLEKHRPRWLGGGKVTTYSFWLTTSHIVEVDLEGDSLDRIKDVRVKEVRPPRPNYVDNFDSTLLRLHSSYGGGRSRRQSSIKNKLIEPAKPKRLITAPPAQSTEKDDEDVPHPASPASADLSASSSASDTTPSPVVTPITPTTAQKPHRQQRNQRYRAPAASKRSFDLPHEDNEFHLIESSPNSTEPAPESHCRAHSEQAISINEPKVKQKTRPTQRHDSFDDSSANAMVISTSRPSLPQIDVSPQSKLLFLRMFGAVPVTLTGRSPVHFNDFVAAMIDAGFSVEHSGKCGGSGVNFKDLSGKHGGRKISFHRPHPDPKVSHHKLRTWGTRLQDKFGWDAESFGEKD